MYSPSKPFNNLPPLPPPTELNDSVLILRSALAASDSLRDLRLAAQKLPNQRLIARALSVPEAVASQGIENINTTVAAVFEANALEGNIPPGAEKETEHYLEAMDCGFEHLSKNGFLASNDYVEIQKIIEPNKAGIRKIQVTITDKATGEILYTPPAGEALLRTLLKNYEHYFNEDPDKLHAIIKSAILHYQFEAIHPFMDGNGRTGRILAVLYMVKAGLLGTPLLFLSGYLLKNRSKYYTLLRNVSENGDWQNWCIFFCNALQEQAEVTRELVEDVLSIRTKTRRKLTKIAINEKEKVLEFLLTTPVYTIRNTAKKLKITRQTAAKYLRLLSEEKILKTIPNREDKREILYYFPELLKTLDPQTSARWIR